MFTIGHLYLSYFINKHNALSEKQRHLVTWGTDTGVDGELTDTVT